MDDDQFETEARARMKFAAATDVEVFRDDLRVGAKCRRNGKQFELTFTRNAAFDELAKMSVLSALETFVGET
jgi:hypothetical protein